MKTMYLHIGTPKTATTAIQLFCKDNQEKLQENGYVYPLFDYKYNGIAQVRNAHFLIDGLYGKDRLERFEQSEINLVEGMQKIYELFEAYDNIILSDEGIWNHSFLREAIFWDRIQKELDKGIFQIKVIVYLRRQDDYLFSWWNQQIKSGNDVAADMDWNTVIKEMPMIQLDYNSVIKKIEGKVGRENVIVRIFEKGNLYGGSIYADFLNAVGLQYDTTYEVKKQLANPSLNKNDIEVKRILNMMPAMTQSANLFFRKVITNHSEQHKDDSQISMFSKEEYEQFMNKYAEGNKAIAREYFGKEHLFDMTYTAQYKWEPDNAEMLQTMITLLGETVIYATDENSKLRDELKILQQETNALAKEIKKMKEQTLLFKTKKKISTIKKRIVK